MKKSKVDFLVFSCNNMSHYVSRHCSELIITFFSGSILFLGLCVLYYDSFFLKTGFESQ